MKDDSRKKAAEGRPLLYINQPEFELDGFVMQRTYRNKKSCNSCGENTGASRESSDHDSGQGDGRVAIEFEMDLKDLLRGDSGINITDLELSQELEDKLKKAESIYLNDDLGFQARDTAEADERKSSDESEEINRSEEINESVDHHQPQEERITQKAIKELIRKLVHYPPVLDRPFCEITYEGKSIRAQVLSKRGSKVKLKMGRRHKLVEIDSIEKMRLI
ncbi:CotO family spore coat protein [Bacillus massilinigeriensis]|uniref:CotO family spore coat protein n=1 Tax=Bacillus mediterraneensis TaxID=1805474 RepID=UPI0008F7E635|nr:CotO family spore coat protein [Bacillus mediterraneensis]